jgi:copper chaperone NosL
MLCFKHHARTGLSLCNLPRPCLLLVLQLLWFTGCSQTTGDAPAVITWDRDTCEFCRMTISDRGYAAQAWVESRHRHYSFDDIGCLVSWLAASGMDEQQPRLWVADHAHRDAAQWLDARAAYYLPGHTTPMDYGFGATDQHMDGSIDFDTAAARMLQRDERR